MKKITLLFVAVSAALTMKSQMLTQDFVSDPTSNGWTKIDNSSPAGSLNSLMGSAVSDGWYYPGDGSPFAAGSPIDNSYNGLPSQFISVGYANIANVNGNQIVAATSATIDTWLITPTVNIQAGSVFQFATTRVNNTVFTTANSRADHLELRYATGTSITNPSGVNAVGDFTNVLVNINPNYATQTTNTAAVVNNYTVSVANYPNQWTVYSVTIAPGVTPTVGQFAFRYYAPNNSAWNRGFWIGIDGVKYAPVCVPPTAPNITTCAGLTATMYAQGGPASVYYLWDNGTSTTIATSAAGYPVTAPGLGTNNTYTVTALDNASVSCGASFTAVASITGANNMAVSISSSSNSICSYDPDNIAYQFYNDITADMYYVSLFASAPATNYTWSAPGAATYSTVPNIVVKPTSGGIYNYTITAAAGACTGSNVISITVLQTPIITTSPNIICSSGAVMTATSLSSAPATRYLWYFDAGATSYNTYTTVATNQASLNVNLSPAVINSLVATNGDPNGIGYIVSGIDANGDCINTQNFSVDVIDGPTLTLVATPTVLCRGGAVGNISVDGADSYTWANVPGTPANSTVVITPGTNGGVLAYASPTVAANGFTNIRIQVKGENTANGCVATASVQVRLNNCYVGINSLSIDNENIVLYPNPAINGKSEIHGLEGKNTIVVYNMLGQQILSTISTTESLSIDLTNQPSGNYLVKITNDNNQSKTIKFINQN